MDELAVLELFIDELESAVSVPVRMSKSDEDHESDAVLIDSFSANQVKHQIDPYVGHDSSTGEEILQFHYDSRIDITVQSENEVDAYQNRMAIKEHFAEYQKYPRRLSEDISTFELGDGGERTAQFEPSVFRLYKQVQSFSFEFASNTRIPVDVIDHIDVDIC